MPRRPDKSEWQRGYDEGVEAGKWIVWRAQGLSRAEANTEGQHHAKPHDTERAAALEIAPKTGTLRLRVLTAIYDSSNAGLTDYELPDAVGGSPFQSTQPRRRELVLGNWIIDSGRRRETGQGGLAIIWVMTPLGKERYRAELPAYSEARERRTPGPAATAEPLPARRSARRPGSAPLRPPA